jgi:hypothetical protein
MARASRTRRRDPDVDEDVLDEQRVLVDLVEKQGWDVTETDVSVYESPWEETDAPEATVTITARKVFAESDGDESAESDGDESAESDGDGSRMEDGDDGPYRVN